MARLDAPKVALFSVLAAFSYATMAVFVRYTSHLPLSERIFFRNLTMLFIAFGLAVRSRSRLAGEPQNRAALTARGALGLASVWLYFYALDHLILADATMLTRLTPFGVSILGWTFLRERVGPAVGAALLLGFGGALLVIKPRFDLSSVPAFAGALSAVFGAAAYVLMRHLRDRETPETILFTFSGISVLALVPLLARGFVVPSVRDAACLLGIGVSSGAAQLFDAHAYRHGPASVVSLCGYVAVLFSAIFGFLLWRQHIDLGSAVGDALIILSAWIALRD
jgi:drug/metabolite transporter (DMT)-like permease